MESARIVGTLARYTRDFALAEDLAQEALAEALVAWPRDGVPRNPTGWLLTVGRRRAVDAFRRRSALEQRYAALARDLARAAVRRRRTGPGPAVGPRPHRRRRAGADVRRLPPGALARGAGRAHAAGARRPDQRRDRPGVPGADRDGAGPDHPGEEDAGGRAGAVRGADRRRDPGAPRLGAQRALPDLHRGVVGIVRERPDPAGPGPRGDPAGAGAGPAGAGRAGGPRPAGAARAHRRPVPGPARRATASRCCSSSRTAGGGTGPRSGAAGRRWPRPAGSAAASARTASRPRSPSATRSLRRSRRPTGSGSCCSTRR